ncbi:MAG: ADP-ribosylglycohydrolase family protein [Phycisphaerae bacterium]
MASLYDKIYGCLAASRVGSAMGAAVECWTPEQIQQKYGYLDSLEAYPHYGERGIDWMRPPGTTEDGIERQKLFVAAIEEKGGRIDIRDFGQTAARLTDIEHMRFMTEPNDQRLMHLIKQGVPASEVGRLTSWSGLISVARASHPIGLINAGDPTAAARDVREVGLFCFPPTDVSHDWSAIYAAATAEACKPDATVESVVDTAGRFATPRIRPELERALKIAAEHRAYEPFRDEFYRHYCGCGGNYPFSSACEIVSKSFAVFVRVNGDAKQAILDAVSFGRDTDCLAATAGGLAGALSGVDALPQEWIRTVDEATMANPHTNRRTTIAQDATAIHDALKKRAIEARRLIDLVGN